MLDPGNLVPERRRVLLVLTQDQLRTMRRDPGLEDFLDHDEAAAAEVPELTECDLSPLMLQLRRANRLRAGRLLVQSPYDTEHYEPAETALEDFAVSKFMHLSEVCGLLGAKSVQTEEVHALKRERSTHASAGASGRVVSATGSVDHDLAESVRARLSLEDHFRGGASDTEAAWRYLAERGLEHDAPLASLVRLRSGSNPLTRRELSLNLGQDAVANLKVVAEVSGLRLVKASTTLSRRMQEEVELTARAVISF